MKVAPDYGVASMILCCLYSTLTVDIFGKTCYDVNIKIFVSHSREGLMSYKQFIQELEDDILPAEAECR